MWAPAETWRSPTACSRCSRPPTRLAQALITIDDLHWSDGASLEFVLYMLHRLEELPISMVLTMRTGHGAGVYDTLDLIATHPRARIERLRPLGQGAVGDLVADALGPRATADVVQACLEATAGNPFYLRELLLALREDRGLNTQQLAEHARALAPDAVARIVRVRVGRLGAAPAALARSVAILGDDGPVRHAARLAGLTLDSAAAAADALAGVEILLAREPLRFVHPLVGQAIARDIPASERASRHLDAARLLHAEGADKERIASHLLLGRAQGDRVGRRRAVRGCAGGPSALGPAVGRELPPARALEEPPAPSRRPTVLAALGIAEALAGLPAAAEHLAFAIALTGGSRSPCGARARAWPRAPTLRASTSRPPGRSTGVWTNCARIRPTATTSSSAISCRRASSPARRWSPRFRPPSSRAPDRSWREPPARHAEQGDRLVLAQAALQASFAAEPAERVIELAERAWDGGRLLAQATPQSVGWRLSATALCLAGEARALGRDHRCGDRRCAPPRRLAAGIRDGRVHPSPAQAVAGPHR